MKLTVVLQRNLRAHLAAGEVDEAAAVLAKLQEDDPLSIATRGFELEVLVRRERLDEAAALASQLLTLFPGSARIHYLAGQLAYKRKDYAAACACFEESQKLYPHWSAARQLGKALTQAGKLAAAEAILAPLARERPECLLDLAWLYERMEKPDLALQAAERYREERPTNSSAQAQVKRLRARLAAPADLLAEVETLRELGEGVPDELVCGYIEALFKSGQGKKARELLREELMGKKRKLPDKVATEVAWACYRLQAFDVACDLFLATFHPDRSPPTYFSGLEKAAAETGRLEELLRFYRAHAREDKRLYGKAAALAKKLHSA